MRPGGGAGTAVADRPARPPLPAGRAGRRIGRGHRWRGQPRWRQAADLQPSGHQRPGDRSGGGVRGERRAGGETRHLRGEFRGRVGRQFATLVRGRRAAGGERPGGGDLGRQGDGDGTGNGLQRARRGGQGPPLQARPRRRRAGVRRRFRGAHRHAYGRPARAVGRWRRRGRPLARSARWRSPVGLHRPGAGGLRIAGLRFPRPRWRGLRLSPGRPQGAADRFRAATLGPAGGQAEVLTLWAQSARRRGFGRRPRADRGRDRRAARGAGRGACDRTAQARRRGLRSRLPLRFGGIQSRVHRARVCAGGGRSRDRGGRGGRAPHAVPRRGGQPLLPRRDRVVPLRCEQGASGGDRGRGAADGRTL